MAHERATASSLRLLHRAHESSLANLSTDYHGPTAPFESLQGIFSLGNVEIVEPSKKRPPLLLMCMGPMGALFLDTISSWLKSEKHRVDRVVPDQLPSLRLLLIENEGIVSRSRQLTIVVWTSHVTCASSHLFTLPVSTFLNIPAQHLKPSHFNKASIYLHDPRSHLPNLGCALCLPALTHSLDPIKPSTNMSSI